jgi:hypothetical protein
MRIRLSVLKQIIRSEVRRSLYESLHADVVGKPHEPTPEEKEVAEEAVKQLIDSATEEQLLAVLKAAAAAAKSNKKIPPVVKDGIVALQKKDMQVSHRHRRGIRLHENAIAAFLASRLGNDDDDDDDDNYLPNAEDAKAKEKAGFILASLGIVGAGAAVVLTFLGAPFIVTFGAFGVTAALTAAATAALK